MCVCVCVVYFLSVMTGVKLARVCHLVCALARRGTSPCQERHLTLVVCASLVHMGGFVQASILLGCVCVA